jgi:hypothetical protein
MSAIEIINEAVDKVIIPDLAKIVLDYAITVKEKYNIKIGEDDVNYATWSGPLSGGQVWVRGTSAIFDMSAVKIWQYKDAKCTGAKWSDHDCDYHYDPSSGKNCIIAGRETRGHSITEIIAKLKGEADYTEAVSWEDLLKKIAETYTGAIIDSFTAMKDKIYDEKSKYVWISGSGEIEFYQIYKADEVVKELAEVEEYMIYQGVIFEWI